MSAASWKIQTVFHNGALLEEHIDQWGIFHGIIGLFSLWRWRPEESEDLKVCALDVCKKTVPFVYITPHRMRSSTWIFTSSKKHLRLQNVGRTCFQVIINLSKVPESS